MTVYQKGKMWKVTGSATKYYTKEEAEKAAGIIDPLEALRNKAPENAVIEEGLSNDTYNEGELSESPDRGLFTASWDRSDTFTDSAD